MLVLKYGKESPNSINYAILRQILIVMFIERVSIPYLGSPFTPSLAWYFNEVLEEKSEVHITLPPTPEDVDPYLIPIGLEEGVPSSIPRCPCPWYASGCKIITFD